MKYQAVPFSLSFFSLPPFLPFILLLFSFCLLDPLCIIQTPALDHPKDCPVGGTAGDAMGYVRQLPPPLLSPPLQFQGLPLLNPAGSTGDLFQVLVQVLFSTPPGSFTCPREVKGKLIS